ncbi:hypothetical protein [Paenibacillus jiagnxiensis]|uniref:hypothetical protein n=1 Tax=Paenibacillus jiagnxiensis TaxID=3228926 RepID=UPI0033B78757
MTNRKVKKSTADLHAEFLNQLSNYDERQQALILEQITTALKQGSVKRGFEPLRKILSLPDWRFVLVAGVTLPMIMFALFIWMSLWVEK